MNQDSEYDKRQLQRMLEQLTAFENHTISFSQLIESLEGLLHVMQYVPSDWEEYFLNEFSTLESINAETPAIPDFEIQSMINISVYNLKNHINSLIQKT